MSNGNGRLDVLTARDGSDGKTYFTKIGAVFPNKSGEGYSGTLDALPVNGKIILMVPKERDDNQGRGGGSRGNDRGGGYGGGSKSSGRNDNYDPGADPF
jgi:hypothetical protein